MGRVKGSDALHGSIAGGAVCWPVAMHPSPCLRIGRPALRRRDQTELSDESEPRCRVRVLDNPWNTYEEVMRICQIALGCTLEEAYAIAWTIDHTGSAVVLEAGRSRAEQVAAVIRTIGIEVRVEPIA